jgi:hypothetical protein
MPLSTLRSFHVCHPDEGTKLRRGEIPCVIGRDVRLDLAALEDFCFAILSNEALELALLAGAVSFADHFPPVLWCMGSWKVLAWSPLCAFSGSHCSRA